MLFSLMEKCLIQWQSEKMKILQEQTESIFPISASSNDLKIFMSFPINIQHNQFYYHAEKADQQNHEKWNPLL